MTGRQQWHRRRWRFYATPSGREPVREFLDELAGYDAARVSAAMNEVRRVGLSAARHLEGEIYEVRADGLERSYRVLFAAEGRYDQVLLALEAFPKKTQRTPPYLIKLAASRLAEWRARGGRQPS